MLSLLQAAHKSWNNFRQIRRKLFLVKAGHDCKEQEAAFAKSCAVHLDTSERLLHHVREVRAEYILSDSFSECADGVHCDTTKLLLLALSSKYEELLEVEHGGLEVRQELVFGSVSGTADSADDDGLDRKRGTLE